MKFAMIGLIVITLLLLLYRNAKKNVKKLTIRQTEDEVNIGIDA